MSRQIKDFYTLGQVLGTGTFAKVRHGISKRDGSEVAIKVIKKEALGHDVEALENEVNILKSVHHEGIVNLLDIFESDTKYYLVMELCSGGELFDSIIERGHFTEKDASQLIASALSALDTLHRRNIAHRDLKPENMLFSTRDPLTQKIKLADFGFAKIVGPQSIATTACGTPSYVAPEILMNDQKGYDYACDCWSIGVILYVLLCGFPPFWHEEMARLFDLIRNGDYSFPSPYWDPVSEDAKDLIRRLLVVDPARRMTAAQALRHPWIANNNNENALNVAAQMRAYLARLRMKKAARGIMVINRLRGLGKKA